MIGKTLLDGCMEWNDVILKDVEEDGELTANRTDVAENNVDQNISKIQRNTVTVDTEGDGLPSVISLDKYKNHVPKLSAELIQGVLRVGHKMLISGPSKAGKSFLLMELCIAIATGGEWLGFPCKKGRVFYINLEIDPNSCINRFLEIYEALGITNVADIKNIDIWNLRGHAVPLDELVPNLIKRTKDKHYDAIILDPIYKVITGDENNASEMAKFCNQFGRICTETGCAAIYCHHHSKGAQGSKRAMDRASGSGVFARDPDAQLDIIQLELTEEQKSKLPDQNITAWRVESSLREFPNIIPVNMWFDHPIHLVDEDGTLLKSAAQGSFQAARAKNSKYTTREERKERLDRAFQACQAEAPGGNVKVEQIAKYLSVSDKTIRSYVKENEDRYCLQCGYVVKINGVGSL